MPMPVETLRGHLTEAFPDAEIVIDDLAGDGDHYRARIVSSAFAAALPAEQRTRLVSVGRFALRGVGRAQDLFTLDPVTL